MKNLKPLIDILLILYTGFWILHAIVWVLLYVFCGLELNPLNLDGGRTIVAILTTGLCAGYMILRDSWQFLKKLDFSTQKTTPDDYRGPNR